MPASQQGPFQPVPWLTTPPRASPFMRERSSLPSLLTLMSGVLPGAPASTQHSRHPTPCTMSGRPAGGASATQSSALGLWMDSLSPDPAGPSTSAPSHIGAGLEQFLGPAENCLPKSPNIPPEACPLARPGMGDPQGIQCPLLGPRHACSSACALLGLWPWVWAWLCVQCQHGWWAVWQESSEGPRLLEKLIPVFRP